MAYGFARQSDGTLTISSTLGEGTRVSIYLPQGAAETTETEVEALSIAAGNHARRALLVEDKQTVRYAIGRLLERLGYEVLTAESGADALAGYAEGNIDVVVSDVVLAGSMDGVELISTLQQREQALPSVLMSGYSDALSRARQMPPAGVPLLAKPFSLTELQQTLDKVLAARA
jgi:CheY-like chemotaxis protein